MMSATTLPFGLQFAEPQRDGESLPLLVYDETTDLSMITLEDGRRVPFLSLPALQGTSTFTKVTAEQQDTDASATPASLGTRTQTEVQQEQQDSDISLASYLGTNTFTAVSAEKVDSDY
jgi:hypothetical protein